MARRDSLQAKIEDRIARSGDEVFLTREFRSLGGERQVLRALQNTVAAGKLVRLGYGVYGRAEPSRDRKSTRLNSSHIQKSRMPSSA